MKEQIVARRVKQSLLESLKEAALTARAKAALQFDSLPEISLEVPKDKNHGNFAANLAMVLAKTVKLAPRETAKRILAHLQPNAYLEKVEIAGPGFINFYLNQQWLMETLTAVLEQKENYGNNAELMGQKIQLEFVSANPVGPMNVVNARAAAFGDCLGNLFAACGGVVSREYYINDYGVQIETLGRSIEARYRELLGETIVFPEDGYQGEYIKELAQQAVAEYGTQLLQNSPEERILQLRELGYRQMLAEQKKDLAAYGVEYDVWYSERGLHESGQVAKILEDLIAAELTYEADGAIWLQTTKYGDDKNRVLKTSDGRTTYFLADIAYHLHKFERGFDLAIDIWGPDHHGYIPRMKAALVAMGIVRERFEVLIAQQINLLKEGQPFKMSKRRGEFITMADLLQEVGNDAARWFFLMRSPESHLDFDLALAKATTAENPVFYVQYAYARICSIFRQATEKGITSFGEWNPAGALNFWDDLEFELLEKAAHFPELIMDVAKKREPHRLTNYLLELATLFHSYYNKRRFISDDLEETRSRLIMAQGLGFLLQKGLSLLGVSSPQQM